MRKLDHFMVTLIKKEVNIKDTSETKNEELIISEVLNKSTGIDDTIISHSDKNLIISEVLVNSTGIKDISEKENGKNLMN